MTCIKTICTHLSTVALSLPIAALAAAAPVGASDPPKPHIDWPHYAFDSYHRGQNTNEDIIGQRNVGALQLAWSFNPGNFEVQLSQTNNPATARFDSQAIVAANVPVGGTTKDLVLMGDENGFLYALDAYSPDSAGSVVWYQSIGTKTYSPCGPRPRVRGILNAAAIDRAANGGRGAVYVAANGQVWAFDLPTGAPLADWPVAVGPLNVVSEGYIHDSPIVANGQLYIGTSSCDDQTQYFGRVVDVDTGSARVRNVWYTLSGSSTQPSVSGGGIWGWGGITVDPNVSVGGIYVATGNARSGATQQGNAEYINNLSPDLTLTVGKAGPTIPQGDYDYGSTPVVIHPSACKNKLVAALNKTGLLVVAAIGPDGTLNLMQSLQVMNVSPTMDLHSDVAWDQDAQLLFLTTRNDGPAPLLHGVTAFQVDAACSTPMQFAFQTTMDMNAQPLMSLGTEISPPTVAARLAYVTVGGNNPEVFAIATETSRHGQAGQVLWQVNLASGCNIAMAPTLVNGRLFVACRSSSSTLNAYAIPGF